MFGSKGPSFDAALFGSIIGVEASDVWIAGRVTAFTVGVVVLNYRALLFATFDPEVADVSGRQASPGPTRCSCWCCRWRSSPP